MDIKTATIISRCYANAVRVAYAAQPLSTKKRDARYFVITFAQIRSVNFVTWRRRGAARRTDVSVTERISRRKYLRREMAELCSALIRAATEFPRDRKAKIITDVSARLSVPDEGADVRNEWIASTGTSRRRRRVGASKTRNSGRWRIIRENRQANRALNSFNISR